MMISIRRFFKKNAKEGLGTLILVAIVIGIIGLPAAFQKKETDMWVLKVNDTSIDYKNFMREVFSYKQLIASIKNMYGQFAPYLLQSMGLGLNAEQVAFEKLIRQALIDAIGSSIGISIHKDYIALKILDKDFMKNLVSEAVFKNGELNQDYLRKELSQHGITIQEFENVLLLTGIARDFVLTLLKTTAYVPEYEINYTHDMRHAIRDVLFFEIPLSHYLGLAKEKLITDEELQVFFNVQNKVSKRYWNPEYRSGILFKIVKNNSSIVITEDEVNTYYEQNKLKKYIKVPAQVVVEKITSGDLKKKTDEPITDVLENIKQGKHDYDNFWKKEKAFSRGTHENVYEKAAFSLKNKGDVSGVITLADGSFVILRLVDSIQREYKPLDSVKNEIKKELENISFKKQFILETTDLIKRGEIENFLAREDIVQKEINLVTKESKDIGSIQLFDIKKIGNYLSFTFEDAGYVVRLSNIISPVSQNIDDVKDIVRNDMYQESAHNLMTQALEKINTTFPKDNVHDWIKQKGAKILYEGLIDPSSKQDLKVLEKHSIAPEALSRLDKNNMIVVLDHNTGKMLYVKTVSNQQIDESSAQTTKEYSSIIQERSEIQISALVASFYRTAKIEVNELILLSENNENDMAN